ncbi:M1 family metallopeptidase [Promethearchaeum syntrophicum]|uniref:Aminopeptidase n=1 Tax=Promethearchaeum syntrophicum TaxID=2594042 RepID=A0A5B9D6L0_9ARCH|nr:M1 family metallopeptidase [Candidatus Prometheoarchaeum syntrophicum]QEE14734.1 Leucyl aminopeptidase [Candidatus Prometheoarchaeum syntrophicum]
MKPIHYNIHLEPDLENFVFSGLAEIEIDLENPSEKIILNGKDMVIQKCNMIRGDNVKECSFNFEEKNEEITIKLPEEMSGTISLKLEFTGNLNENMLGFYRSKYMYQGETKRLASTQFEEREARAAFPCFDHPSKKATFDIEYIVSEELMAISNTEIIEEKSLGNGKKLVKFARTPIMSSYLLYFGVGPFEMIEDTSIKPTIRAITALGKIEYAQLALEFGRKSITYGEEYTGVPFPISKCDYIAVPDFAFGAMENYGAITFRENAMLYYPGKTSTMELIRIVSIIAHETAHMWFGDLVSPIDWKYIWLNESFATYFTYSIPDHYYPEWDIWKVFILESILGGMERDTLKFSVPVELIGEGEEINLDASSAPIIYQKGAAVIKMLNSYLDDDKFKQGIKFFLEKYKFKCASSDDYWEAFEEATGEPIKEFADHWIHQEGYPIIDVKRKNNQLLLKQSRFTFLPNNSDYKWLIPVNIKLFLNNGETDIIKVVFKERETAIPIPENTDAFKLNFMQSGFYRVKYEEVILEKLGKLILEGKFSPEDIFGISNDLYALIRRGDYTLEYYLKFLGDYYRNVDHFLPMIDIFTNLKKLHLILPSKREEISQLGRELSEVALDKIGLYPKEGENVQIKGLRESLLRSACIYGSEKIIIYCEKKFQNLLNGETINSDIISSVLKAGAFSNLDADDYFKKQLKDEKASEGEKVRILNALACYKDKNKLKELLEFNFKEVPKRNRLNILYGILKNPESQDWLWEWYLKNFQTIMKEYPSMHATMSIAAVVPIVGIGHEEEVENFLEPLMKQMPRATATIKMALESLELYSNFIKKNS